MVAVLTRCYILSCGYVSESEFAKRLQLPDCIGVRWAPVTMLWLRVLVRIHVTRGQPAGIQSLHHTVVLSLLILALHMDPNHLCYVTCHFLIFFPCPCCPHVTFYKILTSLSTAFIMFIKGHVQFLQLLKWPCRTTLYPCGALILCAELTASWSCWWGRGVAVGLGINEWPLQTCLFRILLPYLLLYQISLWYGLGLWN